MTTPERFDEFTRLVITHGLIRGREAVCTMVAIGAAESGLDNFAIGDNAKNGTPPTSRAYWSLGLGWLQHDSYWLGQETIVNGLSWTIEMIRSNPGYSLDLLRLRPGFILLQGVDRTYVDFRKWATFPRKSDPFMDEADAAYQRAITAGLVAR